MGGPAAGHQLVAGLGRIGRGADGGDDLVDVRHGDGEAAEDVAAFARFPQFKGGATCDNFFAEGDEMAEEIPERQLLGPAAVQRQHVAAEADLHGREAEKLVQHHVGRRVALEFDHHADADPVGFVGDPRDALDPLFADEFGDLLDHRGLVDLIGDLVDDDGPAVLAQFLDMGLGADDDAAAALQIGFARAGAAQNLPARGEIGGRDDLHELLHGDVGILDQRERAVDHLAQVVRRDVRRHADRDAARAVDQHVREAGGQDGRLLVLAVVIVLEIDGFLVDIGQEEGGGLVHPHFGVSHGRGTIAVHRAEVALTVQKRQRHGEGLRHPHQRIIDRRVAVGMVFPHRVADGPRRLAVGLVMRVAGFLHRKEDAAVDGFQPVAQVGDRAGDDHAHRVVEIGGLHLGRDVDLGAVVDGTLRVLVFVFSLFRGIGHEGARLPCGIKI